MPSPTPIDVLIHPDFLRLQRELTRRLRERTAGLGIDTPWPRVLVVAVSKRQVQHLRRVLAEPGLAGVDIINHLALARKLAETRGPVPIAARRPLRESLVHHLLAVRPDLELSQYASRHTSVPGVLAGVLGELREAGIASGVLRSVTTGRVAELAELLDGYETALGKLREADAGRAWTDRAGLIRLAIDAAADLEPYDEVIQYGAYDLVGMNLDLVRAIPTRARTFLVPADPEAPAWAFARRFLERHLKTSATRLDDDGPARPFVSAARGYRNEAPPDPLPEGSLTFAHAQGPEAELNAAARQALAHVRDGVPPERIGIVARNLDGYASVAEAVFRRNGLPLDTSLLFPLSRQPKARAFLLLVQTLAEDFPRQKLVDLVRSPFLNHDESEDGPWTPDVWDRWSRRYRIVRGAAAWTEVLPHLVVDGTPPQTDEEDVIAAWERAREDRRRSAEALADVVARWNAARTAWKACGTAEEHDTFLRKLGTTWIKRWNNAKSTAESKRDAVDRALNEILEDLHALEAAANVVGDAGAGKLSIEDVTAYLDRSLDRTTLPVSEPGVRFLDVMQARGMTFEHLILIGFNADVVPRRPRDDVFLPDAVRLRLRETTGRPLAVRAEGSDEEYLLLAQTLAAAERSLTVTWQRADAQGSARPVSLQLRELARLLPGRPTMQAILDEDAEPETARPGHRPLRVPTHPGRMADWLERRHGLLSTEEAVLLASELGLPRSLDAAEATLAGIDPERVARLAPGFRMIGEIERFTGGELAYDGNRIEPAEADRRFSATALEKLGRCPLQYFFSYVLRVRSLDDPADELRFDSRELGTAVHKVLERVYADLIEPPPDPPPADPEAPIQADLFTARPVSDDAAVHHAEARLEAHWNEIMRPIERRVRARFPVLWEAASRTWREELRAFLRKDLKRLAERGFRVTEVEARREATLRVADAGTGDTVEVPLLGLLDRIARADRHVLISDYKTRGNLAKWPEHKEFLTAKHMQLPLYRLMLETLDEGSPIEAELLGIGFSYLPASGFVRTGPVILDDDTFSDDMRDAFAETLGVLLSLERTGRYPFKEDAMACGYCDYRVACRRYHVPSIRRVEAHEDHEPFFLMKKKSKTVPTLDAVRAKQGGDA